MTVLSIARFTFKEALRKKVLLGAAVLSLGFLALFAIGNYFAYRDFMGHIVPSGSTAVMLPVIAGAMTIAGLYVVNFLAGLLAIFAAVGTIASEIDSGTLHAIVPKPVQRWEIVLGKWLGYALMLGTYLTLMSAGVILTMRTIWGVLPPNPAPGIAMMLLCTLLLLSLTVLGSTLLATVANGIVVFMLYGVALLGGFIEQLGSLVQNETMVNIGIITSLLIPSDVLWKMASYLLQPQEMLARSVSTPIFGGSAPNAAMTVYAVAYTAAALFLAIAAFNRRDL